MGMSTHVIGFVPPDEKWRRMKAVWDACSAADTRPPESVGDFFGWEEPDDLGVEIGEQELIKSGAVREWNNSYASGYEVVLANLPDHVKVVRVYNSW